MPTYDYQCQKCEFEFEREQRITEEPIKTCPKCKSRRARRLLSAPSFILKGGGWYADGYGSRGAKKSGDSDGSESKSSDADSPASSKKADSTTTAKSEESKTPSKSSADKNSGKKSSKSASG